MKLKNGLLLFLISLCAGYALGSTFMAISALIGIAWLMVHLATRIGNENH